MVFKVKIYLNRVQTNYQTDFAKAKDYFKRHRVNIDFEFVQSNYNNLGSIKRQLMQGERVLLNPPMYTVIPNDPAYDIICFAFNQAEFSPLSMPASATYGKFIELGTHILNPNDLTYVEICHELMHALVVKANLAGFPTPDVMDTYENNFFLEIENSNFGKQWKLLEPYINSLQPTATYTYFTQAEVDKWKLEPRLWQMLDKARGIAGIPFRITSGRRSVAQNEGVGGVNDSSHLLGLACDLRAITSNQHYLITKGLIGAGFRRISRKYPFHIHCDIDEGKPQDVLF